MVIGIKFCGGCNPKYDRRERVCEFMEANPGHEYVTPDDSLACDIWMAVCGCSRSCADISRLKAKKSIVLLWNEAGFRRMEQEIKAYKP